MLPPCQQSKQDSAMHCSTTPTKGVHLGLSPLLEMEEYAVLYRISEARPCRLSTSTYVTLKPLQVEQQGTWLQYAHVISLHSGFHIQQAAQTLPGNLSWLMIVEPGQRCSLLQAPSPGPSACSSGTRP